MGALAEAGVTLVGENRLQDLEAKQRALGRRLRLGLHRQPPEPQGEADPAARAADPLGGHRLGARPARAPRRRPTTEVLVEVNVAGEEGKGGVAPGRARRVHRPLPGAGRRADDDAAVQHRPGGLAARTSRASPSSPPSTGSSGCRWARARTGRWRSRRGRRSSAWAPSLYRVSGGSASASVRVVIIRVKETRVQKRTHAERWPSATHGTARSSTSASPRTPTTSEPDLYEPDTGTQGEVYEAPRRAPATVSRIRERRRARDEIDDIFADDEPIARRPHAHAAAGAATAAPTSASTWSPRTASTTPRRSPTSSSRRCR